MQIHNIAPVFDENSKILILGSFPSVMSREERFYYAHPQNRFWRVLENIFNANKCETIEEKKQLLLNNNIALWDVIKSCRISGSSDSSISDVIYNDLSLILNNCKITKIICNGSTAFELLKKGGINHNEIKCIRLPSTSSANAAYSLQKLINCWKNEFQLIDI